MGSLVAVVNDAAGSAAEEAVDAWQDALPDDVTVEVVTTGSRDDVDAVIERLPDGGELAVLGGDGSVHLAVGRLHGLDRLDVAVTIVPLGTGNDLARTLGIPLDPVAAARCTGEGSVRSLDLFVLEDGTVAVNAAHAGVGAVAAEAASELKDGAGKLAYPLGALRAGIDVDGWDLEVAVDGRPLEPAAEGRTLLVAIGNGATVGGGTRLCPEADPSDGLLDVVVCCADGPAGRAAFAASLIAGRHLGRDDVAHTRGTEIVVRGGVPWNVDGELTGEVAERVATIRPGAWRVRVPPPDDE